MMSHLEQAYQFDIHIRRDVDEKLPAQGVVVVAKDIEQGVVYQNGDVKVTAFTVDHAPVKPAFGYRVDYAGHSVVLSGDTRYSENLIQFSQGTDLLIHEVLDPEAYLRQRPVLQPGAEAESDRPPHDARTGRKDLQPGETKARGLFPYRAVQRSGPGGAHQKNLFRTARSGRRPDEHSKSGTRSKSIEPRNRVRVVGSPQFMPSSSLLVIRRRRISSRSERIPTKDLCSSCRQQRPIVAILPSLRNWNTGEECSGPSLASSRFAGRKTALRMTVLETEPSLGCKLHVDAAYRF